MDDTNVRPDTVDVPAMTLRESCVVGGDTVVDEDLLSRLRRNDRAAWEGFYDSVAGELRGYAKRIGARDPDDILGEVMVQVVRDLPRFAGTAGELRPWVYRIARNRVIDAARRRARRVEETALEDDKQPGAPAVGFVEPGELAGLLELLTEDQREAVWLRFGLDMSLAEAAEVMGREPAAVAALTMRAMNRLRRLLAPTGR